MTPSGFRDLKLRVAYGPGDDPLNAFYIPVLSRAVRYDRSAGYFSSEALVVAAQGLAHLIANGGSMRLLVGAELSRADVEAIRRGASLEEITRERLVELLAEPEDELKRKRLEALAWMVAAGTLEIKVVLPKGPDGHPLPAEDAEGYYHTKKGLFEDAAGDRVGFSGSINESKSAWKRHFEEFHVFRSWVAGELPHISQVESFFGRVWENRDPGWISLTIPKAVQERLLRYRPEAPPEADPLEAAAQAEEMPVTPPPPAPTTKEEEIRAARDAIVARFLLDAPHLLGIGDRLGQTTATIKPWPHQLRVASEIVKRFPERFLLADEVGLGKTIEAGLAIRNLMLSGMAKRCLILAPASVLKQWQDELREKLCLDVPIYDGKKLISPGPDRTEEEISPQNVFSDVSIVLASSQLVKRKDRRSYLLASPDWDLVVIDEAHHARRKDFRDPSKRSPNRLLELLEGADGLEGLSAKTRGLLLLTATPMQIAPIEVWDLLLQLGLPGRWGTSELNFVRYFSQLDLAAEEPEKADWEFLAAMAEDEVSFGGPVEERIARSLEERLGVSGWERIRSFPGASDPRRHALRLSEEERGALLSLLRHLTPLRRRMFRHTRSLLKRYEESGLLPEKIAERKPVERWLELKSEERALYDRIDKYTSDFYEKYEGTRKGLGFVMTIYRRRLTSSFYALEQSLRRRLAFLRGRTIDLGLTDEDLEEDELSRDVSEELGIAAGTESGSVYGAESDWETSRRLKKLRGEEIAHLEDFLDELSNLATDTKFDRLVEDLQEALAKRESVVIFSQYADTIDYLKEKLRPVYAQRIACYTGRGGERWTPLGWTPAGKEEIKRAFAEGEIQILLGTDALAEGLNLQTCGVEINYDAPWNPMRLEQRIGRIDRIGQRHDEVWIWTYFYEDTVEADVYKFLVKRIDWFQGVVGKLQPILSRVERTIRDLALERPELREQRRAEALRSLEEDIERLREESFDLDALTDEAPVPAEPAGPPATPEELEKFFLQTPALSSRLEPHPEIEGAYLASFGSDASDRIGLTFDPGVADEHPDSVRLVTFGDRVFEELLRSPAESHRPTAGLIRAEAALGPRKVVAWYGPTGDHPQRIETLGDLYQSLLRPGACTEETRKLAEADFKRALRENFQAQQQNLLKLAEERFSALRQKATELLARAAYIWAARRAVRLLEQDTEKKPETAVFLADTAVDSMVQTEGYPFGPLKEKASGMPALSDESPLWMEIKNKNQRQLDGLWRAVRHEGDRLIRQIVDAEKHVEKERAASETFEPKVESEIV